MTETLNPCQQFVQQMAGLQAMTPVSFRILKDLGKSFPQTTTLLKGPPQQCYQNAYHAQSCDLVYAEGYAMKPGLIPLSHAWLVDPYGRAVDPTWKSPATYFGVKFDPGFMAEFSDQTGYYGVFESLYMLKLSAEECYKYVASGVMK